MTYSGDTGNLSGTSTCDAVTVNAPAVLPAPKPEDAPVRPAAVCGDPVVLLDVSPAGKQARLTGIARLESAGQTVTIQRAGKPVGTATVGADGAFTALVGGPAASETTPVTYTAWIGAKHSRAFRYDGEGHEARVVRVHHARPRRRLAVRALPGAGQARRHGPHVQHPGRRRGLSCPKP